MNGLDEERGAVGISPRSPKGLSANRQGEGSRLGSVRRRERLTLTKFRQQMLTGHGERRSAVEHDCYGEQAIAGFQLANP